MGSRRTCNMCTSISGQHGQCTCNSHVYGVSSGETALSRRRALTRSAHSGGAKLRETNVFVDLTNSPCNVDLTKSPVKVDLTKSPLDVDLTQSPGDVTISRRNVEVLDLDDSDSDVRYEGREMAARELSPIYLGTSHTSPHASGGSHSGVDCHRAGGHVRRCRTHYTNDHLVNQIQDLFMSSDKSTPHQSAFSGSCSTDGSSVTTAAASNNACTTENITCPICLLTLSEIRADGHHMMTGPCGHIVCDKCMNSLLTSNLAKCPSCRLSMTKKSVHPVFL